MVQNSSNKSFKQLRTKNNENIALKKVKIFLRVCKISRRISTESHRESLETTDSIH